jgi:hypothetical protein
MSLKSHTINRTALSVRSAIDSGAVNHQTINRDPDQVLCGGGKRLDQIFDFGNADSARARGESLPTDAISIPGLVPALLQQMFGLA